MNAVRRMKTYAYGVRHQAGSSKKRHFAIDGEALIDRQLAAAHRYYNRLVELDRERHQAVTAATSDDGRAFVEATDKDARRRVRADCGAYWGTYLLVEDAHQRARHDAHREWRRDQALPPEKRADKTPWPRFRRWTGEGSLGVQIQGGMSPEDLTAGNSTRARLVGTGRQRKLWLRVGSDERAPVWAKVDVVWHRELPTGCNIKWVRLVRRKVATHATYSAQFVLEMPAAGPRSADERGHLQTVGVDAVPAVGLRAADDSAQLQHVGIDVGWRKLETGEVRVASWVSDAGEAGELRLSAALISRWEKCADLASIRQRAHAEALAALLAQRDNLPEWVRLELRHAHVWKAPRHLVRLALAWRARREDGDATAYELLESWRRQDRHLYDWEMAQRQSVVAARDDAYRVFARTMARRFGRVVVEALDVRELARRPETPEEKADESHALRNSRGRRFVAALGRLLSCLGQAVADEGGGLLEVPAPYTTLTCHACGSVEDFDAATELEHVCSGCGVRWDQDQNAARNLLRAGTCSTVTLDRSRRQPAASPKESVSQQRRLEGKRRRMTDRSQAVPQPAGVVGRS